MLATIRCGFLPNKVVAFLDPDAGDASGISELIPLLAGRPILYNTATAYVCENYTCGRPVNNLGELENILYSAEGVNQGGSL
jgi:hypothetical protein